MAVVSGQQREEEPSHPTRSGGEPGPSVGKRGNVYTSWNVDPEDQGCLPEDLIWLSRTLARVLRHGAGEFGFTLDGTERWLKVSEILSHEKFAGHTEDDVKLVVKESYSKDKPRFELKDERGLWIRASHKPSRSGRTAGHGNVAVHGTKGASAAMASTAVNPIATKPHAASMAAGTPATGTGTPATSSLAMSRAVPAATSLPPDPWCQPGCSDPWGGSTAQVEDVPTPLRCKPAAVAHESTGKSYVADEEVPTMPIATEVHWQQYLGADGEGPWWWCEATNDGFIEACPGPWVKYLDPDVGKVYWYNTPSEWFWEHSGSIVP